jgi:AhpD family alkylhydroperoxidase
VNSIAPLGPVLRSLVTVRVWQINRCNFCVDINSATLAKRTGSMDKVERLAQWRDSALFDETEQTVLKDAEAVIYPERRVTDELMGK